MKQLIAARDKYLKPSGTIIPDTATLHLTTCSDREYKTEALGFWDNVYGFRMLPMKKLVYESPSISPIPEETIVTTTHPLLTINAYTVTLPELAFDVPFTLTATNNHEVINYLVAYPTIQLTKEGWKGFTIRCSPDSEITYLQQCCFTLEEDLPVNKGDVITGTVKAEPEEKKCDITISVAMQGSVHSTEYTQKYEFYN
eukprot:TRINITY_DN4639_c0_g1_i2.p2 TRINITY_DN4639_c0_g1~~TRINITY_DN4639_c0_g1_i2.p2  ORF type:complete len:199 (+),score=68.21 TRINITY_DN4639_c0_g1_i2:883-1479(+)